MVRLLVLLWVVVLGVPPLAQELRDTDALPASEIRIRPNEPTVRLREPEMVELQNHVQASRWSEAKVLAEKLAVRNPQDPKAHFWLGYVQLRQYDSLAAIRSLRRAQELGLQDPQLHLTLGLAYYAIHQFVLFKEQMQKAIHAAPRDAWPYYYLGLYDIGITENYEEGRKHFREALSREPGDFRILAYHGFCLEILGARDLARRDYETAIQLLEEKNARFSLPYQRMAILLTEAEPALALQFARKAATMEKEVASNHLILAKLYEDEGKTSEAIQALNAAVQADPTLASPHYRLHRLYAKRGDLKLASQALTEFQILSKLYGS
jgi:Flp pilus assembly protein TadD